MENQEITSPPVQNPSSPKLVYVLIGILVLFFVGIGGYLLGTQKTSSPVPTITPKTATKYPVATAFDEVSGWQMYKDSALGFEFKYPSIISLKLEKPDNYRVLQLINQNGVAVGSLVYYDNPNGLSLKEFENKLTSDDRSGEHVRVYTPTDEETTTVSGEVGFFNSNGTYEPFPSDLYIFPKDRKIFIWIRYQNIGGEYKREDFVNEVLSTFKFLDEKNITSEKQTTYELIKDIARWKIVEDNSNGSYLNVGKCADGTIHNSTKKVFYLSLGPGDPDTLPSWQVVFQNVQNVITQNGWVRCTPSDNNPDGTIPNETFIKNGQLLHLEKNGSMGTGYFVSVQFEYSN